jgi:ABC-type Na+ efflux pump permease subunit
MSAHHDDDQMRALLAPLDTIEPVTRSAGRRSARRPLLASVVVVCSLAAAGVAVAAGLGAFSGKTTVADVNACNASTVALTTASGAQVLTGHTDAGVYCVAYKDPNGAMASSAAKPGETPVGQAVAVGALDTASNAYVIAGVVPPGYNELSLGAQKIAIKNQAFLVDWNTAVTAGTLSGPAGTATVNLDSLGSP